ncbi:MAG: hypothetical protein HYY96_10055 [Candidatus Tectomicrobia bacterium]|nr:hypothetical protein [Candidatus Tectomicrobia bacterium]
MPAPSAWAHHGGLSVDWDDPDYDAAAARWQQEVVANGYRVKYLAYPRNVLVGRSTRLVFEVQAVQGGLYKAGLPAELVVRAEGGGEQRLPLPEPQGVTGYYETRYEFPASGVYQLVFQSRAPTGAIEATFSQPVRRIDAYQVLGFATVGSACLVTWLGMIIALRRRILVA